MNPMPDAEVEYNALEANLGASGFMLSRFFHGWEDRLAAKDKNRIIRSFEWGTDFAGNGISARDPRAFLLDHAREALRDSRRFYSHRPVNDYAVEGKHLVFTSPLATPYSKNNRVHAWHFPTDSDGRAVLVLPQWNSDAEGHMALCRLLNRFGLSALRLSLPYHDLRMPEDSVRAEFMVSPNLGRTLQAVRQAVLDARATLDWLESQGYRKLAILGTSLGSCVALITQAHDARVRCSVLNHVSTYFADVVWTGIATRHVRAGLEGNISLEDLREIWMPISPRAFFARLAGTGQSALLVHARYDTSFLPQFSRQVLAEFRHLGIPHSRLQMPCGHYSSGQSPFKYFLGLSMCAYLRRTL